MNLMIKSVGIGIVFPGQGTAGIEKQIIARIHHPISPIHHMNGNFGQIVITGFPRPFRQHATAISKYPYI